MREQALNATRFLYNQSNKRGLSLDELKKLINSSQGKQFLNTLVRYTQRLQGTRPYWNQKWNELTAYTKNINKGSLFFTLSTTNLYWYNLQSHIPQFNKYKDTEEAQRHRIAAQNLTKNPHIAAYWLY